MSNAGKLRIVFLGMCYLGSPPALRALLRAGYEVSAVIIPGPAGAPPVLQLPSRPAPPHGITIPLTPVSDDSSPNARSDDDELIALAHQSGIPVLAMPSLRHERAIEAIAARSPDLIVASCFPLRVPRPVRSLPRLGCLNVHPSLLPRWRGPEPVFWALRAGDEETGVTIHLMDAGWDTGPILVQERVSWPEGARLPEIERMLSERGAELLLTAIEGLVSGRLVPAPQDDALATYAPVPRPEDYVITTDRDARWAYRFARAIAPLVPAIEVRIVASGATIRVRDAVSWFPTPLPPITARQAAGIIDIAFTSGIVCFAAASSQEHT